MRTELDMVSNHHLHTVAAPGFILLGVLRGRWGGSLNSSEGVLKSN